MKDKATVFIYYSFLAAALPPAPSLRPPPTRAASLSSLRPTIAMASEVGVGGDDLDGSLFEGMVLFSSSVLPLSLSPEKEPTAPSTSQDPVRPLSPSPPIASSTSSHSKSGPLNEDLFSDLSLQISIEPKDFRPIISSPAPIPSPAAPGRHISRKKKRGFRIGYGREAVDATPVVSVDDLPHSTEDVTSVFSSGSTPSTSSCHEELPDGSGHEDVEVPEIVVSVKAASDGDGLSPSRRVDSERDVDAFPSTAEASEKDTLELIEDKLNLLRSRISAKLEGIQETAILAYSEKKELERRRRKAGHDVNQALMMYKDLEKQLEVACEAEDFERAERVSDSLVTTEKEKDRLLNKLRETELDCDYVDSRMQEVLNLQIAAEVEGIEFLEQFAKDATDRADLIHRNAEELSSKDLEDWQTSMEMLETSKLEMDIETKLISDARSALDSSIEDLVKDDRKEVEGLMKKRVALAKELDELLNLVRLKESEIAENESQIHEAERKISEVASEFHEKSSTVDTKHDNLKSAMSKIDSEQEVLSSKKKQIDEFISLEEQKCFNLKELANVALDEAKIYQDLLGLRKELASSFIKSREDKVQLVRTEEKILEEIQVLRQQISSARIKLQELSSTRVGIQQDIDLFKQRIAFVDKRGPELEAEKKVAAAARNFKEAGRIAAEAKTLNSDKESVQNKMDMAVLNLENLDGDIKSIISIIQENEELALLKEKEAAIVSFKRLQLISAAARSERSAALELGDSEEGEFLLKEAEAAEERARELQGAYNLNPEDHGNMSKYFSPVALIIKISGHNLAEMVASLKQPVADE